MQNAIVRVPSLEEMGVVRLINGPEAFTPDGEFILGPSDVRGFWVAAGFCAHGLAGAGGMGQLVAEWIVEGTPSLDVWHMDSRRFGAAYRSREYTLARTQEIYETYYDVKYPGHERSAGRPLRLSPAYDRLVRLGAVFGEKSGWERANWFEPNAVARRRVAAAARLGGQAVVARDRRRAPRLPRGGRDLRRVVVREDRRLGPGAAAFLESLCANRVARDVGAVTYTQMLNGRGGIECDFTVTRLADERFRIVTGTAFGQHDLAWIRQHAAARRCGGERHVADVTSALRVPRRVGAARRALLQPLTTADLSQRRLPVHARPRARGRAGALPRRARHLRRRARLGALLPGRVRRPPLGHALGGGRGARARRRRLQGDRLAPAREGLPRLGRRHHARGLALRGRARLRRQARQGRLRRPRRAGSRPASPSTCSAASCSTTRVRSRSAPSRSASATASSAASRAAATATPSSARSRTPTSPRRRRRRDAGRGRDLRRVGRGRGRGRAALRPEGERIEGRSRPPGKPGASLRRAGYSPASLAQRPRVSGPPFYGCTSHKLVMPSATAADVPGLRHAGFSAATAVAHGDEDVTRCRDRRTHHQRSYSSRLPTFRRSPLRPHERGEPGRVHAALARSLRPRINRRYGAEGHLFHSPFWSRPRLAGADPDGARVHRPQPVRHGLCRHPREWRRGSYREIAGLRLVRQRRRAAVGHVRPGRPRASRKEYVALVDDWCARVHERERQLAARLKPGGQANARALQPGARPVTMRACRAGAGRRTVGDLERLPAKANSSAGRPPARPESRRRARRPSAPRRTSTRFRFVAETS